MNLGDIYLKTFLVLTATAFALSFVVASLLRIRRRVSWSGVVCIGLLLGGCGAVIACRVFHQTLFVAWHKTQNEAVPSSGCITYEPDFTRLYATYEMTRTEFDAWIANHPWKLKPGINGPLNEDGLRFGITEPDASFETEMAPNGKQLRVYFKSGIMYLAYHSM